MIVGAGLVCWNLGRVDGYQAAKAELLPVNPVKQNQSEPESKKSFPTQISNFKSKSSSNSISSLISNQSTAIHLKSDYRFADNSRSVAVSKRVIEKVMRINQSNIENQIQSAEKITRIALLEEKTVNCRWTVGRLDELKRVIESGGKGKNSRFCGEFGKRGIEMLGMGCLIRDSVVFSGIC